MERHLVELGRLSGATVTREDASLRADLCLHPRYGPALNYACRPRWSAAGLDARLEAVAERLRAHGEAAQLQLVEGLAQPVDLADRLAARGWTSIGRETVLWTRRPTTVPHLDPGLRIEAVGARTVEEYEATERRIFGIPTTLADERRATLERFLGSGELRAWLVRRAGQPVATARLSLFDGLAGVHGIGVLEEARRAGLGTLVTVVATRAGLALGARLVWLSAATDNGPANALYTGLGFQPILSWRRMVGPQAASSAGWPTASSARR